jgi:cytochrome c-type biogenesis protein CcmF
MGLGKISVGPPYFDTVFMPLMAPLVFLMGVGPLARWKQASLPDLARRLRWALGVTVVAALASGWLAGKLSVVATVGLLMAWWVVAALATDLWERIRPREGAGVFARARLIPRSTLGMMLAHLGIAVFIFGVTMVKSYEVERDVKMNVGDQTTIGEMSFIFRGVREITGPNYRGVQAWVEATTTSAGAAPRKVADLLPEKRVYRVQQNPMTEAAIRTRLQGDLYVSLGEALDGGAWTVRIYVKPFVDWIWGGCLLMAFGGFVAASDRRYRQRVRSTQPAETTPVGPLPQVAQVGV